MKLKAFLVSQFWGGHPNTFRTFFAASSFVFGAHLLIHPSALDADVYRYMRAVPSLLWAALFIWHWVLLTTVVLRRATSTVQFLVNGYGFMLWSSYVALKWLALNHFPQGDSMEVVAIGYSGWCCLRTRLNRASDRG